VKTAYAKNRIPSPAQQRKSQAYDYDADIMKNAFEKIHGCRRRIDTEALWRHQQVGRGAWFFPID
jgi:hypothetical protein